MPQRLVYFMAITLAFASACAADPPASKSADGSFPTLKQEYKDAFKKYGAERQKEVEAQVDVIVARREAAEKALQKAKTDEEKKAAESRLGEAQTIPRIKPLSMSDGPGKSFSPRFLEFAEKHPNDPAACESVFWALRTSGAPWSKDRTFSKRAIEMLAKSFAIKAEIKPWLRELALYDDADANNLLREVMEHNPDRKIRARACQALAEGREGAVKAAEILRTNAIARRTFESMADKERAEVLIAKVDLNKEEAANLRKTLREKFGDVIPDLSIGKPSPDVQSKDIQGKPVKLSDLKGHVVVLDIWATWCGPCRAMISHEREMVLRLKDKQFALVSISADEDRETLRAFLAKTKMPWTQWWNGPEGGIIEDWDVRSFPTIYVLDAKGIIRHKDIRGEKLEEAVNELLREIQQKK